MKQIHASLTVIKPTPLMTAFWSSQRSKGLKPKTLWAIQHLPGSVQPIGYLQGWNKDKVSAQKQLDTYLEEYPKAKVTLVPIKPPSGI